jgi:hypothetical protein
MGPIAMMLQYRSTSGASLRDKHAVDISESGTIAPRLNDFVRWSRISRGLLDDDLEEQNPVHSSGYEKIWRETRESLYSDRGFFGTRILRKLAATTTRPSIIAPTEPEMDP